MQTYPNSDLAHKLDLILSRKSLEQVTIELQESYGDRNRELVIAAGNLQDMVYVAGVLIISVYAGSDRKKLNTEIIPWDRVKSIRCEDMPLPKATF